MKLHLCAAAACVTVSLGWPGLAAAQSDPQGSVVITGSVIGRALAETPYAISAVGAEELRSAGPLIHLSEALARVPGLSVANRGNYAQDLQISSRGFGARATFGVRGVRLYSDGIPASGPDGQGQVSHFDLASAARVEVLRGPFSVLYGNSSGGVIALVSAPVRGPRFEVSADAGSFGLRQLRAQGETRLAGNVEVRVGAATLSVDGYRPHSEAQRNSAQASLGWTQGADSLRVSFNYLDQPAQDPLGLTRALFDQDPLQTTPEAERFDTRKTTRQSQLGGRWQHRFDGGVLREASLALYGGNRSVTQFLAIAAGTQAPARHGGGVVDFDRSFGGADARLRLGWDGVDIVLGLASDRQRDDRRGFNNYTGTAAAPVYGVAGTLRRNETNRAATDDAYVQAEWALAPALALNAGVRSGRVNLGTTDAFLGNGDDAGASRFNYTNPVLGLRWEAARGLNLHAAWARGTESPTLGEVAYRLDGTGGFNASLKAQQSEQVEIGAKWRSGAVALDAALFHVATDNEIGVATNAGGRSAFQNTGRTLRQGAELAGRWAPGAGWSTGLAATWLDATYRDGFFTCGAPPCNTPNVPVAAGKRIAGTQRASLFAELAWRSAAWGELGLELRRGSSIVANDTNSDAAAGALVAALRWQHEMALGWGGLKGQWLLRVDNVSDRRYAGSVIVNEGNSRYFETAAPRSVGLSLRLLGP